MEYLNELSYMSAMMAGVSKNTFKIEPTNTTEALAGRKVSFALPTNALLDFRSLSLHFGADANQTAAAGGRLPPKIASLIDRVELSASGQMIQQGFNGQNVLQHVRDALMEKNHTDHVLGHSAIVRAKSYVDGFGDAGTSGLTSTENESYPASAGQTQFAVTNWLSFPGTCQPAIQNVGLLPDLILSIYFAGNEVLGSAAGVALDGTGSSDLTDAGTATAAYKVYNLHLTIDSIGLSSSVYDAVIASEIASAGFVPVTFKNYFSYVDTHSGSTKFSVATQSLDRVWVATRATAYDTSQKISIIKGYKGAGVFTAATSGGSPTQDVGLPGYDIGGVYDTNSEKYTTAYFNFSEVANRSSASVAPTFQLQLNGQYIPQFKALPEQLWAMSKNSVPMAQSESKDMFITLDQFRNNYFGFCVRLNLPGDDSRIISGLDTRSVALQGYINSTGLVSTTNMIIFAECSSTLRIGSGRQINIII